MLRPTTRLWAPMLRSGLSTGRHRSTPLASLRSQRHLASAAANPADSAPLSPVDRIMQTALTLVPEYGWTRQAVEEAVKRLGYPPITHGVCTNGPVDLIDYFLTQSRLRMLQLLNADPSQEKVEKPLQPLSARDKIYLACKTRLQLTVPVIDRWQEVTDPKVPTLFVHAAAILAQPSNLPVATKQLYTLTDDILYYAGDRSADMQWYSKRAGLAGIYTTTEVYMTEDRTPQHEATFEFLNRQLDDVESIQSMLSSVKLMSSFAARSAFNVLVSVS
ncbi:Ubiquinone biosynthesis protein coq9, mitochondrial [Dimargaris xerosporica]|nr:Ubiquinone biosynthesis protein coq9, mitochondrial [Dimargaris xerosporica]